MLSPSRGTIALSLGVRDSLTGVLRSSKLLVSCGWWLRRIVRERLSRREIACFEFYDPGAGLRASGQKKLREIFVAETHLSAARAAPPQETRIPQTHEDPGWTKSPCHTPQKRAPRPHARLTCRGLTFHAKLDWYGAQNTTRCIVKGAAEAAANSLYSYVPMA
jgi:hypothetical protein